MNLKIKWPNDLYLDEKKLGGILVETSILRKVNYFLFGVGINLVSNPKNLSYPTTSLVNFKKISPLKLFLEISKTITNNYFELKNSSLLK